MNNSTSAIRFLSLVLALASSLFGLERVGWNSGCARADEPWSFILPEQRRVQVRSPEQLCPAPIPRVQAPNTVARQSQLRAERLISLSEAINTGLANSNVVRVLSGLTATSSGRTVYDVAITNAGIDEARAAFDPTLVANQAWQRNETPVAIADPLDPNQSQIVGSSTDDYALNFGLNKRTLTGGSINFAVRDNDSTLLNANRPLNPQTNSAVDLSYTQPLLRGAGASINTIPIVLARINTERSFFQYKNSVQSHVLGVIEAYWQLVLSRTVLWSREQQVRQLDFAIRRADARQAVGDLRAGDTAQVRVAYENAKANLIVAQADLLSREAALENILGFPPGSSERLVPASPLVEEKAAVDWEGILNLAETQRPDIIELKLVLEADRQRLLLSRNQALPQLDGVALYRWDGLRGEMPNGLERASGAGEFADWNIGINFSVPIGLRSGRALMRQQELIVQRDRVNLDQGLHAAVHLLALNVRNLDQFYEQYLRFKDVRKAATANLENQVALYEAGTDQVIVALQAIADWGNAVRSEAQSLVQYNIELARLEQATGSILEAHGIAFYEERFGSISPWGRMAEPRAYPMATRPTNDTVRYPNGDEPSEEAFELTDPLAGSEVDRETPESVTPILAPQSRSVPAKKEPFQVRAAKAFKKLFK
ncbi:MAG: TolC family protein [Aureliella sp.]